MMGFYQDVCTKLIFTETPYKCLKMRRVVFQFPRRILHTSTGIPSDQDLQFTGRLKLFWVDAGFGVLGSTGFLLNNILHFYVYLGPIQIKTDHF